MSETFITTARIRAGQSTDVLRALARDRAPDATIFETREPFFWLSEISNDRMDSYYGYMDAATTLVNFAADAAEGRAVLAAHNRYSLPFGASLTGSVERTDDRTRVLSDAYTLRDLSLGGVDTNSFIDAVRSGIQRDISVGFTVEDGGLYRCNVCGHDMMDYGACSHWPGMTYEVKGEDGVLRQVLATFTVIGGRLSEYSAVYDGATPSAGVLKIRDAAQAGAIDDRAIRILEQRYRMRLPERVRTFGGIERVATMPQEIDTTVLREGEPIPWDTVLAPVLDADAIHGALVRAGAPDEGLIGERIAWLGTELARLRPLADDGRAYRTDLITEALTEGVRAMGQEFSEETYRGILDGASLGAIKRFRDDWARLAAQRLPAGRQTIETTEDVPATAPSIPAAAYRA